MCKTGVATETHRCVAEFFDICRICNRRSTDRIRETDQPAPVLHPWTSDKRLGCGNSLVAGRPELVALNPLASEPDESCPFYRPYPGAPEQIAAGISSAGSDRARSKKETADMTNDEAEKLTRLAVFLRVYGVLSLVIFGSLFIGFTVETPLLADDPRGGLNWLI